MASDHLVYFFTETAARDLDEILGYILVNLSNPTAAKDFYDSIFSAIDQALSFSDIGVPVNNPLVSMSNVRKLFIKNYTLYYVVDVETERLIVLRIVYSHRNMDEIIMSLRTEP